MVKRIRDTFLFFSLCFCLVSFQGCFVLLGAVAGAGGIAYVKGGLEKNFDKKVSELHRAGLAGLKDLELFISDDEINLHSAYIIAETDKEKEIRIDIEALTERSSKIKIRVGVFGNEVLSQSILNAIQKRL